MYIDSMDDGDWLVSYREHLYMKSWFPKPLTSTPTCYSFADQVTAKRLIFNTKITANQSGRSKYKTGVVSFLLCMTYHADITLTYFCIYNEFVTPILKTFVFLSRYPIYRLKPQMNNLRTLATHIDRRKWKIKIFCGRKIFMKSGPSFQHFHKKSHQKCHAILPHS